MVFQHPPCAPCPPACAITPCSSQCVAELVGKGADPNWMEERSGTTALMVACNEKHAESALALAGAPEIEADLAEQDGCTSLWVAASEGMCDVVDKLMGIGADINKVGASVSSRSLWARYQGLTFNVTWGWPPRFLPLGAYLGV